MGKKKKNPVEHDDVQMDDERVEQTESEMIRIRITVAVNGHQPNDKLTVARDHPFYSSLVNQKLAEIVS